MQPFQQRVVDEKTELDGKIDRLRAFIIGDVFTGLPEPDQTLLIEQCKVMARYSDVLARRIARFTKVET